MGAGVHSPLARTWPAGIVFAPRPAADRDCKGRRSARLETGRHLNRGATVSTADHSSLLIGVFYDRAHAERAFQELQDGGFGSDQLSVALLDTELAAEGPPVRQRQTKARTGAAIGLGVGGVLGSGLGVLTAIWLVSRGPVLVLGLVILLLAAAAGVGLGALVGALAGWAIREDEFLPVPVRPPLSKGIVTVRPSSRYDEAAAILRRHAGCDTDSASTSELPR